MNLSFKTLSVILPFLLFFAAAHTAADEQNARPNILFIVADDLGYGELGCYGGKEIPTPRIDALAAGVARFASGYVTAPFCAASRAALMTGRYQTRFGFEFNPIGAKNVAPGIGLPVEEKTIGQRLRDSGYLTGKPAELPVRSIQYSLLLGQNVLDLFGGSGSSMIGAEQTGRNAFLMELDATYADVIPVTAIDSPFVVRA